MSLPRTINNHKANTCNEAINVWAVDDQGPGNASHKYLLEVSAKDSGPVAVALHFQNGPIAEVGVNGITHEALLAVLIDRLQGFQSGPYACRENAIALTKLEEALMWLNQRTRNRQARGVEGTHQV